VVVEEEVVVVLLATDIQPESDRRVFLNDLVKTLELS
jgi:hypothetical protein